MKIKKSTNRKWFLTVHKRGMTLGIVYEHYRILRYAPNIDVYKTYNH